MEPSRGSTLAGRTGDWKSRTTTATSPTRWTASSVWIASSSALRPTAADSRHATPSGPRASSYVKKVSSRTGSGPLSHLFAQGIVAVDSLTDPETWHTFVDLVREQYPDRADELGMRPHTLVFAMHRSNGLLTADRLFTFARSELASAAIPFQRLGVRLQICVIP